MAIRLRIVNKEMVALCAAKSVAKEDDIYLDDGAHYALACKFARDHLTHGIDWNDPIQDALAQAEEAQAG